MACGLVEQFRLSEAEKDVLVAKLDAAAALLGADKPPKLPFRNDDGTWDVGCTLEGEPKLLAAIRERLYLGLDLP